MKELHKYVSFNSISEMDNAVSHALQTYELKESERIILLKLSQYSCKFIGVSYLKNDTLAQLTGYSKRTVQRAIKRLTELGIISRYEQLKPVKGGYGAFICVINPISCHFVESPCTNINELTDSNIQRTTVENETIISKTIPKDIKERNELDITYLAGSGVPTEFIQACSPFYNTAKEVKALWWRMKLAQKRFAPSLIDFTEIAVSAFKQSIYKLKAKRIKGDFKGYLFGVASNMLSLAQRKLNSCNLFDFLK
ncbi:MULTISPECIES: helix-turn-helix domain-containing protein [Bacillus]|uniref:helix-turn-helix domain-containing protein n=1 Tax=Bacillus TaxID=1386 RepID=UPI0011A968DD|nr:MULTISPECIES: helix-turn-helix domain-containing protein [Bacillus]MDX9635978.1 helix-turn-helix domain-containing protein [Bacillus sp. PBL-C9]